MTEPCNNPECGNIIAVKDKQNLIIGIFVASMTLPLFICGILYGQVEKHEGLDGHPVAITTVNNNTRALATFKQEVNAHFEKLEAKIDTSNSRRDEQYAKILEAIQRR